MNKPEADEPKLNPMHPAHVPEKFRKTYEKYVKEHRQRERRAIKEYMGDNLNAPPEKDYT